jgi:peptidoglycan/xylan/chitin deacetylase (PgdA/CDA1 family)
LDAVAPAVARGGSLPKAWASLTFDDGYRSLYEHALPILIRYGLSATVFLVAGTLISDRPEVTWVDERPADALELLSLPEILEMRDAGVSFGSHSLSHATLTELSEAECVKDLRTSREILGDLLGERIGFLAYPRGVHDEVVRRAASRAGFTHGFGTMRGPFTSGPYAIPRVGVYRQNSPSSLRLKSSRVFVAYKQWRSAGNSASWRRER